MPPNDNKDSTNSTEETIKDIDLIKPELFDEALEKRFGKCELKQFNVGKHSGAGENYAAVIFQVNVEVEKENGTTDSASFIAKLMSPNNPQAALMKNMMVFEKEVEMYENYIPKFEKLFREHGVNVQFAPRYWKTCQDPEILIMDNLTKENFENINRRQGMNMEHATAVLSKLAKFHAASVVFGEQSGGYPQKWLNRPTNKANEKKMKDMQSMIWANVMKNMKLWNSCEKYREKLEKLQDRIGDIYLDIFKYNPDEFNVLVHGDLWANNIMFQHGAKGELQEVLFVDLQLTRYRSPAQDLIYFILSSTENSIKVKEFDFFINYYHNELVKSLKLLKYSKKIPSLVDLHISIFKQGFIGIATTVGVLAVALLDPNDNANIANFFNDSEDGKKFKQDMYTNPRFIKACEIIFPFLDNKGILDV